jgi:hypothetical protein
MDILFLSLVLLLVAASYGLVIGLSRLGGSRSGERP